MLISDAAGIAALVKELEGESVIAFDTEFIRESTFYPIVEIIQVATRSKAWVVDVQPFKKGRPIGPTGDYDKALKPLLDILARPDILKIVHAAQGDQECLYTSFGMTAAPVLDTAVAAALSGYGDNIGLARLMKAVLDIELQKGHARTNWSVRPLPEPMIRYALADVEQLVELSDRLVEALEKQGRLEWAKNLSDRFGDTSQFDASPDELAMRLARGGRFDEKGFGALVELMHWREKRVREVNVPRRWLADDSVLMDLARVKPHSAEHLGSFRGLNKGEIRTQGEVILEAIRRGVKQPRLKLPPRDKPDAPTADESQALELIKCYLGILAEEQGIAARHLSTVAQLLPLLRKKIETEEDLVKYGVLSQQAAGLIGNQLLSFIRGETALRVRGHGVETVELKKGE